MNCWNSLPAFLICTSVAIVPSRISISAGLLHAALVCAENIATSGHRTKYVFDATGNLAQVVDNDGNTTVTTYNNLGWKIAISDPDKGNWTYEHNNFGELEKQTNANSQTTEITFDGLGRMRTRVDKWSGGTTEANVTWTYDTSPNGLGQLDNVLDSQAGYMRAPSFDALGRIDEVVTNFDAGVYFGKTTYDSFGRVFQVFDAAGDGTYTDHGLVNSYNSFGYVESIGDAVLADGQPRTVYKRVLEMTARGAVKKEEIGTPAYGVPAATTTYDFYPTTGRIKDIDSVNDAGEDVQDLYYVWDELGNLTERNENSGSKNLQETFLYDDLNRLTSQAATNQPTLTVTYDAIGNIKTKTGVTGTYTYGAGAGPHAATFANGSLYSYDSNGNNVGGGGRTINYSTFDKPLSLSKGGHTTSFAYGPERARYRRIDDDGTNTTVTRYIGGVEIIERPNGTQERKRYIAGVAIETGVYSNGTETSRDTVYTFKDHLGSMDVITDNTGTVVQELSFGAWGQRRDASDWTETTEIATVNYLVDLGPTFDTSNTTRGFTGHEMVDAVGVIHMNGRIYDPILGRFLQADPYVQDAKNSQSLNRYSYVLNNPLNATDPSGYFVFTLMAIAIASNVSNVYIVMTIFAVAGTLDAVALGADWSDALQSGLIAGVSAGAFFKVGKFLGENYLKQGTQALSDTGFTIKILAHGVIGGVTSTLQGGKFGHGFAAAFATATATKFNNSNYVGGEGKSLLRVVIAAGIGGSVSKLTGGKFGNGAMTGAFSQALNAEAAAEANFQRNAAEKLARIQWEKTFSLKWEFGASKSFRGVGISQTTAGDDMSFALDFSSDKLGVGASFARSTEGVWAASVQKQVGWENVLQTSLGASVMSNMDVSFQWSGEVGNAVVSTELIIHNKGIFQNVNDFGMATSEALSEWFNATMKSVFDP